MPKHTGHHYYEPKIHYLEYTLDQCDKKYYDLYELNKRYLECMENNISKNDCYNWMNKINTFISSNHSKCQQ